MDPNANLEEQRRIRERTMNCDPWRRTVAFIRDAKRLAELSEALDEWINNGGFLPADWER